MNRKRVAPLILLNAVAFASTVRSEPAQPFTSPYAGAAPVAEQKDHATHETRDYVVFKMRYVRPSMMAWWVDPEHNAPPPEVSASVRTPPANVHRGTGGSVFALPKGIESVIPIDAKTELLVVGTATGIENFKKVVEYLDKPQRQIEIEAHFVSIHPNDVRGFGIDWSSGNGPFASKPDEPEMESGTFRLGYVRNFPTKLRAAATQGRAKIITAPRVTTLNNLTASVSTFSSDSFLTGATTEAQPGTAIELTVTPTINQDGTITLLAEPQVSRRVPSTASDPDKAPSTTIKTIVNIKEGETIALTMGEYKDEGKPVLDARIQALLQQGRSADSNTRSLLLFLTARVVPDKLSNHQ